MYRPKRQTFWISNECTTDMLQVTLCVASFVTSPPRAQDIPNQKKAIVRMILLDSNPAPINPRLTTPRAIGYWGIPWKYHVQRKWHHYNWGVPPMLNQPLTFIRGWHLRTRFSNMTPSSLGPETASCIILWDGLTQAGKSPAPGLWSTCSECVWTNAKWFTCLVMFPAHPVGWPQKARTWSGPQVEFSHCLMSPFWKIISGMESRFARKYMTL